MELRDQIVANAREYLGTPWKHNQSLKGVGIDCVQFGRVVAESVGIPQFVYENYGRSPTNTSLLDVFDSHPNFKRSDPFDKGDILILRISGIPHHVAIATSKDTMIHADMRNGVVETTIGYWRNRILASFEVTITI